MLQTDKNHEEIQDEIQRKCECLVSDHHGVYVPKIFISRYRHELEIGNHLSDADLSILENENPRNCDFYWDIWQKVLDYGKIEINGETYQLAQNGDLFAIKSNLSDDAWDMFYY